jgi:hypothetical protein
VPLVVALVLSAGVIGGGLYFLLTRGDDGTSPERTVETFLVAVFDGECADAVDLVTESGLADLWLHTSNREEAIDVCQGSPLDASDDDRQATLDSVEETSSDGDQATVTFTTAFDDVTASADFRLVQSGDDDWMINAVQVDSDEAFRGFGVRFLSPEETVEAFVLADVEGDCVASVDLTTEGVWTVNWNASTRQEALAGCEGTSVAEPSDIQADDLQATLDSALLITDDGTEAIVALMVIDRGSIVHLDYRLVMDDAVWKIDDILERLGGFDPDLDPGPDPSLDAGPPAPPPSGDPALDPLAQDCYQGNMDACDALFLRSEIGSPYEDYGFSCGGRLPVSMESCIVAIPSPLPPG